MASPQTEQGYIRLARELAVALYRFPFSGYELRLIMWVIRDSYGWNRKETSIVTISALAQFIAAPRASIGLALQNLVKTGIIAKIKDGRLKLNKNYDEWLMTGSGLLPFTSNQLDDNNYKASNPLDDSSNPLDGNAPPIRYLKTIKDKRSVCKPAAFTKPTIEEVIAYCIERKNQVDPQKFFYHYEGNGWMVGRVPMKNWKSSICYWERSAFDSKGKMVPAGKVCPLCDANPLPYPNAVVCDKCQPRCRKCGKQTARIRIVRRPDGTKTTVCADDCDKGPIIPVPKATKQFDEDRKAKFMAEYERRKQRKEITK